MNKQLAKIGSTLNKNMTNTDALNLTGLHYENASFTSCSSDYIESTALKCKKLHLPTAIPTTFIAGTMYYNVATQ